jgi:hypothetical protein
MKPKTTFLSHYLDLDTMKYWIRVQATQDGVKSNGVGVNLSFTKAYEQAEQEAIKNLQKQKDLALCTQ